MNAAIITAAIKQLKGVLDDLGPINPGVHDVDGQVTVRLHGTVAKGNDVAYVPTVDIPLLSTLALVLEKSGFQRERSKALLIEAMQEALAVDASATHAVARRVKDIEEAMAHVRSVAASLPHKVRTGPTSVRVSGEVTVADGLVTA